MLLGLDPLLNGEALAVLRDMGHGDSIALVDANFPAHYLGPPTIRLDTDLVRAGRAILSVLPLDGYVDAPILRMEVDGGPKELNEAHQAVRRHGGRGRRRLADGLARAVPLLRGGAQLLSACSPRWSGGPTPT